MKLLLARCKKHRIYHEHGTWWVVMKSGRVAFRTADPDGYQKCLDFLGGKP